MPTVARGDAEIAYTTHGAGPGLVLVHGTGASGTTTWSPLLRSLAAERTVVVPDLRGSGGTVDPGGALELPELASDVLAVAADAGLDRFDLAGFSLGGAVAIAVAAVAPEQVRSLIVIAASPSGRDSRSRLQFELWADLFERDRDLFARYWLLAGLSPAFLAAIPSEELGLAATFPIEAGLRRQCELNLTLDLGPLLATVQAPTLVIGCAHDTVVPVERVRALAAGIDGSAFAELDTGHMAILEAPRLLAATILEHINADREVTAP
jgi:3-oxoadipate enol-lactonase